MVVNLLLHEGGTENFILLLFFMENISDGELWGRAVQYGEAARRWRQKFLGLLPEIARRELWRVHGFESVFVFAFKVGGVSENHVKRVLSLEQNMQDKPILHRMLIHGEVSVNKMARVGGIATKENQEALAAKVQTLSLSTLKVFVQDYKAVVDHQSTSRLSLPDASQLGLSEETIEQLLILKQKGFELNALLQELLKKREEEIYQAKEAITKEQTQVSGKFPSRYIPAKIKSIIKQTYGTKCAISNCHNPSQEVHHTARYSLLKQTSPYAVHNPNFLAPLCKQHHQIAHSIDVKYQECRRL